MKYYEGQTVFSLILHDLVTIVKVYESLDGYMLVVMDHKDRLYHHTEKEINILDFFNGEWWSIGRGDEV